MPVLHPQLADLVQSMFIEAIFNRPSLRLSAIRLLKDPFSEILKRIKKMGWQ